ncbi:hypothetical protein BGP76_18880 [Reichenbachiella sp. MSK19-1]|nr:hypothetical protein BGP76_18880 [Reichenbachiella sp. MSK19-1]
MEYSICPICYWEDDPVQFEEPYYEGGANRVSLIQARINYNEFGACELDMKKYVRSAFKTDKRKQYSHEYLFQNKLIPYWYQLLKQYLRNANKSGLTIPYLYGGQNEINCESVDFENFLESLITYNAPKNLTIQNCKNIGEYVIGLDQDGYLSKNPNINRIGQIIILDQSWNEIEVSTWIKSIINHYSEKVAKGNYSKNDGIWGPFNEEDKNLLRRTNEN